ncbi:MAG: DUF87 domain-containing protein [Spirochaetales bacterium]|nr:DUF87 domain-containing protein [Spirochaetales bacterium]
MSKNNVIKTNHTEKQISNPDLEVESHLSRQKVFQQLSAKTDLADTELKPEKNPHFQSPLITPGVEANSKDTSDSKAYATGNLSAALELYKMAKKEEDKKKPNQPESQKQVLLDKKIEALKNKKIETSSQLAITHKKFLGIKDLKKTESESKKNMKQLDSKNPLLIEANKQELVPEKSPEPVEAVNYQKSDTIKNPGQINTIDQPMEEDKQISFKIRLPETPQVDDAEFEEVLHEPPSKKNKQQQSVTKPNPRAKGEYKVPVDDLLNDYSLGDYSSLDPETRAMGEILMNTLEEFKISAEVTGIRRGPVITMYEILPAPGVKLSKIVNLADNIALRLAASSVRIVAPIPGKHAVGIEVPNKKRALVSFKEMIHTAMEQSAKLHVPIVIGKDITGEEQIIDLVQTPHLLIAGATGSGKSVCVNSIITSILCTRSQDEVKLILIDPKIVELKFYNDIPHLLTPVITDPKRAFQALQYCLYEMERRYSLLDALGVRDISSYNRKAKTKKMTISHLPYIVVIIDEFADLIAVTGKEMEATIARLAAMSRAVGIHIVLATQRPSVEVITGLIKANIPSRIAFMVASKFDSRIIIDAVGAEKLLGKGDMLFSSGWYPFPIRMQGAFLEEEEVERLVTHVKTLGEPDYIDEDIFFEDDEEDGDFNLQDSDPLMDKALDIVVSKGKASASYLQRRLKIGYNRAARIVEEMEMRGIVGPPNGSKPRDILHIPDRNPE